MNDSGKLGSTVRAKPAATFSLGALEDQHLSPAVHHSSASPPKFPKERKHLRTEVQAGHGALLEGEGR